MYLGVLQLVKHLVIDLLNHVSRQIDRSYPRHRAKSSAAYVRNSVVAQVQAPHQSHAAKSVGIEFANFVAVQIQHFQQRIPRKRASVTEKKEVNKQVIRHIFLPKVHSNLNSLVKSRT